MNRDSFETAYRQDWIDFESMLDLVESRSPAARSMSDERLGDFPARYRRVCQQLALARARSYGTDIEQRLNRLALRGHQQLYRRNANSLRGFFGQLVTDFPRAVRLDWRLFALAAALLYVPQFAMQIAVRIWPELIFSLMDPSQVANFETMYETANARSASSDFYMFGFYILNNVSIAFRTFASGILFGLGTVFFLVFNGTYFGAVAGHIQNQGLGHNFFPFVIGHGSFEITAIVLAGQCGLKLGGAILMPGRLARSLALRRAAHSILPILYGLTAFLFIAAFIEAFWSSTPTPAMVRYIVGSGLWALVLSYLLLVGRR